MEKDETYQTDDQGCNSPVPRGKWLQASVVRKGHTIDALRLHATVEANVGYTDTKPGHEASNGCHIGKPGEDRSGTTGYSHEGEKGKRGTKDNRDVGETGLGCPCKDLGCITNDSHAICIATWSSQPFRMGGECRTHKEHAKTYKDHWMRPTMLKSINRH